VICKACFVTSDALQVTQINSVEALKETQPLAQSYRLYEMTQSSIYMYAGSITTTTTTILQTFIYNYPGELAS